MKTQIYNLIVLDESGSMDVVKKQTIGGCNETINTIRIAQKNFEKTQEHFVSIFAFQSEGSRPSRYLMKNVPVADVQPISGKDYDPCGMTPLYDALGSTLVDLKNTTQSKEDAIGSVTIITDGMENSSEHYSLADVSKRIEALKELGWNFNFIGANIDVEAVASKLNIDNTLEFTQDECGTKVMFERERTSRMGYYGRLDKSMNFVHNMPLSDQKKMKKQMLFEASRNYFDTEEEVRIAPSHIDHLEENEIFVFGSNLAGQHGGGAAWIAYKKFGAIMGQGVGLQGQSYGIPTMHGGVDVIKPYVDEFIDFAKMHPELKFLVTRIGCGIAGFQDSEVAPLFKGAVNVENIYLPKSFLDKF